MGLLVFTPERMSFRVADSEAPKKRGPFPASDSMRGRFGSTRHERGKAVARQAIMLPSGEIRKHAEASEADPHLAS